MSEQPRNRTSWMDLPALILFLALAGIVLLQFISRYVLNDSVAWTEEIARYLLIGVAYAGSVTALRKGEHIFLEFLYRRISPSSVKPLALLVDVITVGFHAILTALTVGLALQSDRRMISVDLPKSLVYWFVAAMLALAAFIAIRRLLLRAKQSSSDILDEMDQSFQDQSLTAEDTA